MARAEIDPGACGLHTTVKAVQTDDGKIGLEIESECAAVRKYAAELGDVDAFQEFAWRGKPRTHKLAPACLSHPACPVPTGIIKAVEIAAGLNLPSDVLIKLSAD